MKAKYVGNGRFFRGIPARDLTAAEFEALTDAQQQTVIESDLYELQAAKKKTRSKKSGKDGE